MSSDDRDDPDDDDPTPRRTRPAETTTHRPRFPHGVPVVMSDDARALGSWRNGRTPAQLAAQQPARPRAAETDYDEITSPIQLLERDPDDHVRVAVERSRRDSKDPALWEDVVKLAVALTKERSGARQRERDLEQVLRAPHEATRSTRRHSIVTVAAAAIAVAGAVIRLSDRPGPGHAEPVRVEQVQKLEGEQVQKLEGEQVQKLKNDQLQHEIERIDGELREIRAALGLGRRSELTPKAPAGALPASIASKGTLP